VAEKDISGIAEARVRMRSKVMNDEGIAKMLVRGPSVCLSSSERLGWKNIAVERHTVEAGEKAESRVGRYFITLASGHRTARGERKGRGGGFIPYSKPPGFMNLNVEGVIPAIHTATPTEIIVCSLDRGFVQDVAAESEAQPAPTLRERTLFCDEILAGLVRLLERESSADGESGLLFIDHLAYSVALRMLALGEKQCDSSPNALPMVRLKRVIERMRTDLTEDIDLKTLAAESGYSRNHFLRMFRTATGQSPHQYLMRLRIEKAEEMMREMSLGLIDIALACGFSSHAHLTRVFRDVMGVTPSSYRRHVLSD
jgi:AraC family transcriptional regulator